MEAKIVGCLVYYFIGLVVLCFLAWFDGMDVRVKDIHWLFLLNLMWPVVGICILAGRYDDVVVIRGRK
jgi:hypothetical protein